MSYDFGNHSTLLTFGGHFSKNNKTSEASGAKEMTQWLR